MIKEAIGEGATLEEAKAKAISALNAPFDANIKVEVVEQPKKKTLGLFGGSLAKIKVSYEAPDEKPAPAKKEAAGTLLESERRNVTKSIPKKDIPASSGKKNDAPAKDTGKKADEPKKANEPKKAEAPRAAAEDAVPADDCAPAEYLREILTGIGFESARVTAKQNSEEIFLSVDCEEDYGSIIGRRGETLDALQYLVRLSVNRTPLEDKRVTLNIGDYRSKREDTLRSLAKRQASRVLKYGRNAVLDPMNPYERRIIHTTIQEIENVDSHSIGEGDNRRVVITLAEGAVSELPPRRDDREHGYNNNRGGFRGNNRGGRPGGRPERDKYVPKVDANRSQHVDAAASMRYGKVEPKKPADGE